MIEMPFLTIIGEFWTYLSTELYETIYCLSGDWTNFP